MLYFLKRYLLVAPLIFSCTNSRAISPEASQSPAFHVVRQGIELSTGLLLSSKQQLVLAQATERMLAETTETIPDGKRLSSKDGRIRSTFFCLGLNVAVLLQAGVAGCANTAGNSKFLLVRGAGASAGFAGELFVFIVHHAAGAPIHSSFVAASTGSAIGRTTEILRYFGVLGTLLGPKLGIFYSHESMQEGLIVGVRVGRIWELGVLQTVETFNTVDELTSAIEQVRQNLFSDEPKAQDRLEELR